MTTSFRAKFPVGAIKNLKVFEKGSVAPADWARAQATNAKVGDIIVCFNPFSIAGGDKAELETSAVILVFNAESGALPLGILLTDDFYVVGTTEAIFRERAVAAAARGNNFSYVLIPHIGVLTEDSRKFITAMQRWGSGGTRANPMHGLPDPLVAFFACVGATVPPSPAISVGVVAQALVKGVSVAPVPNLGTKYAAAITQSAASENQAIASVTVIETPSAESAPPPADKPKTSRWGATSLTGLNKNQTPAPAAPAIPPAPLESPSPDISLSASTHAEPSSPASAGVPPASTKPEAASDTPTESGFLSIRKRLEARLAGRLPKTGSGTRMPVEAGAPVRSESVSPVVRLVSNIRQQMSIASDNLEYRVSTLKSKMLDRLVSCKHNLSEKEQTSLKALEDLRTSMLNRLETTAAKAKDELSKTAAIGTAHVREFQLRATGRLSELLAEQELLIAERTENAKRLVNVSLSSTKDELNKTVNRAQHTLRGLVTTTEVNLNQVVNQCGESMDERIEGFRAQTQILAEGIGLSVESLGEAAKMQAQQSEEEIIKRLEALSEESVKGLREQSVKAEMECSKLIDKLSRDKLVPTLQDKRKIVVEMSAFYHDEFAGVMSDLLETKMAEFEPIVRSNSDSLASSLQDFKSRWTTNLEQHQKDLDEMEQGLKVKVEEHLAGAKARVESMQDITKVTDHVLTSPELIRTRDETCLKFDMLAREHVSRAYAQTGDKVQSYRQESIEELSNLREESENGLRTKGEESRTRIRNSIKAAMQKISDLQTKYTA